MNSRNQSETECYNISVAFQIEGICDIFKSCGEVRLLSQLMKSNENDSVSINEDTTEVIVEIPNQCIIINSAEMQQTLGATVQICSRHMRDSSLRDIFFIAEYVASFLYRPEKARGGGIECDCECDGHPYLVSALLVALRHDWQ